MHIEGYVHSFETAGAVDGPGLRFVVFMSGCPLRCLYCHNPDSHNKTDGKLTTAAEVIEEISKYKDFLIRTDGGVTASGGEPLFQQEFVTEIFKGCKNLGLHTALDTSGYLGAKVSKELLDVTDLVLLDIKSFDPKTYAHVTGSRLQPTLDFARHLSDIKKPMWIRCVLVPGLTDDMETFSQLADFLSKLNSVERIEILPFHKMGEEKWKALKRPYKLWDTQPPSPETVSQVKSIFEAHGLITV